jgi:hypothetical protein
MAEEIHLVDPDGNKWVAGTAEEANDLQCQGYRRVDQPAAKTPPPTPAPRGSE